VLNFDGATTAQRVDAAGVTPLPFVENPNYGLAVWQGASPADLRLAWGTMLTGDPATTQLFMAEPNPGGFDVTPVVTETLEGGGAPYHRGRLPAGALAGDGRLGRGRPDRRVAIAANIVGWLGGRDRARLDHLLAMP